MQIIRWPVFAILMVVLLQSCDSSSSNGGSATGPDAEINSGTLPPCKISPAGGYYNIAVAQKITISCPTDGASVRYTIDGTVPNSSSDVFIDSVRLRKYTNFLVVTARSWKGAEYSPWVRSVFMDSLHSPIYIDAGALLYSESIRIGLGSIFNSGWKYLYTVDGTDPAEQPSVSTQSYVGPFVISGAKTLKVKAVRAGIVYPVVFAKSYFPVSPYSGAFGLLADERDNQSYKTIQVGAQTWMAENLRYQPVPRTSGATCYGGDSSACKTDGVLYKWAMVMDIDSSFNGKDWGGNGHGRKGICPTGWHIPNDTEWNVLQQTVDSMPQVGAGNADLALLSISDWLNNRTWQRDEMFHVLMEYTYAPGNWSYNGVNLIGFNVLPAGFLQGDGSYGYRGYYAGFWTSNESKDLTKSAYARLFYGGFRGIFRDFGNYKNEGHSLRCIKD